MPAAILDQGKTAIRNSLKTLVTHIGLSTDSTAFSGTQTALDPSGSGTNLIKAATKTDVSASSFDATISVNGTTELTGQTIRTIAAQSGSTRADALTRSVRGAGIGVESGDVFTIGLRFAVSDAS